MKTTLEKPQKPKFPSKKKMTLTEFLNWKSRDKYVYEWNNGILEKKNAMQNHERYIIINLQDKFSHLKVYQDGGRLIPETDCQLNDIQVRRPDLAYFTRQQIIDSAHNAQPIPLWVVEIISENDNINKVEQKNLEYFQAGVAVVWHIFPEFQLVKVYSSFKEVKICTDDDICIVNSVIPDLKMTVNEIFKI